MKLGIGETIPFSGNLCKMISGLQPESLKDLYVLVCGWNWIYILKLGNAYDQITSLLTELVCIITYLHVCMVNHIYMMF